MMVNCGARPPMGQRPGSKWKSQESPQLQTVNLALLEAYAMVALPGGHTFFCHSSYTYNNLFDPTSYIQHKSFKSLSPDYE